MSDYTNAMFNLLWGTGVLLLREYAGPPEWAQAVLLVVAVVHLWLAVVYGVRDEVRR